MGYSVIRPTELMDGISANQLRREIGNLLDDGAKNILVDLQDVTFMNSSAIGTLVATYKKVREKGSTLSLCSLNDQVRLIFELTKMNHLFDIFIDRQDFEQKKDIVAN